MGCNGLAVKTVRNALEKMGFVSHGNFANSADSIVMSFHMPMNPAYCVTVEWEDEPGPSLRHMIKFGEGRWTQAPNVHIVSYFSYPRTLRELEEMCANVRKTYESLCNIKFK